nr:EOG090X07KM [Polyphemus pediculus]
MVLNVIHQLLNYTACLLFLPISVSGKAVEAVFSLIRRVKEQNLSLEGKVVLITGASSGLGEALAQGFYKEGCKLILASRKSPELERVRDQLLGSSYRKGDVYPPVIIKLDLEETNIIPDKVKTILGIYGHVDILVNNAGVSYRGEILNTALDVDVKIMKVNYFGTVMLTKALLPSMVEHKSGHILMIGSIQAKLAIPFRSAYAAPKHALQAFSDCLRAEMKSHNIGVTVINPGYIRTSLSMNALTGSGQLYGKMDETTESGADPHEAAEAIVEAVKLRRDEVQLCSLYYRIVIYLRVLFPNVFFLAMGRRAAKLRKTA